MGIYFFFFIKLFLLFHVIYSIPDRKTRRMDRQMDGFALCSKGLSPSEPLPCSTLNWSWITNFSGMARVPLTWSPVEHGESAHPSVRLSVRKFPPDPSSGFRFCEAHSDPNLSEIAQTQAEWPKCNRVCKKKKALEGNSRVHLDRQTKC